MYTYLIFITLYNYYCRLFFSNAKKMYTLTITILPIANNEPKGQSRQAYPKTVGYPVRISLWAFVDQTSQRILFFVLLFCAYAYFCKFWPQRFFPQGSKTADGQKQGTRCPAAERVIPVPHWKPRVQYNNINVLQSIKLVRQPFDVQGTT